MQITVFLPSAILQTFLSSPRRVFLFHELLQEKHVISLRASVLFAGLLLPVLSFGQSQLANGGLEISVYDAAGASIAEVKIDLVNKDTGFSRSLITNGAGVCAAPLLPLGAYDIMAQKPGFASIRMEGLILQVGEQRSLKLNMKVSSLNETVTVNGGDADLVESEISNSTARLDDRAVHNLPILARNFQTFILLTPGALVVNRSGTDANFSVGGQKGIYTGYSVDGADYSSSFYSGQSGGDRSTFTISLEAIKEFVVLTNGFNAEYGHSGGAVLTAVTKSGTNQIHGNGFWYFQDHKFVADNALGQKASGRRQQFGGTLGGPIKRDKLFFFAASDNQRRNTPINLVFNGLSTLQSAAASSDPARQSAAQAFLGQQKQVLAGDDVTSVLGKTDWLINASNTLSARYNRARNTGDNATYSLVLQQARSADSLGLELDSSDAANIQLTTVLSSRALNEFRFNFTREDRPRLPHAKPNSALVNGVAGGSQVVVSGIGTLGNATFLPVGSLEHRQQFTDNFTYTVGRHSLKFGADINLISFDNVYRGNSPGVYTFFNFENFVNRQPDQYAQFFGSGTKDTHPKYFGIFAEDSFHVKPGLTVNYGLRWEGQANPSNDLPNANFLAGTKKIPNDLQQWSPRLGIAWDPKNDGKNVIRAYTGYIYAPTPSLIWANVLRQNGDISNGVNYLGTNAQTIPTFAFPYSGPYPTAFNSYPLSLPVTTGTVPGGQVNLAAAGFHNPRIFRTNVAYERLLTHDTTITVTYDRYFTTGNERRRDMNLPAGTVQPVTGRTIYDRTQRPFSQYGQVIQRESTASSRYHAVTLALNKRFSHRFQGQVFYTYAHNNSDDDNENQCCSNSGYDQKNFRLDWSRSALDVRHNMVANAVVQLPWGIEASPILKLQSGRPFDATTGTDNPAAYLLSAGALSNFQIYIHQPGATVYGGGNGDTTSTDRPIVNGKLLPRNYFEQPKYIRTDLRVAKAFHFRDRMELKGSVDILNLFYNSNRFTTNTAISNPAFGSLNNVDDPFSIQTGIRFTF